MALRAGWMQPRKLNGRQQARSHRPVEVRAAIANPYRVLGLTDTAELGDIKRAYRKLALQHHPDLSKAEDAERTFLTITQAYEVLTGRARGKEDTDHASANSWDFHDWYWNFRISRTWEKQQTSTSHDTRPQQPGYKDPESRENLRSQMAGLRHRAAVRANRPAAPATPTPEPATPGHQSSHATSGSATPSELSYPHHMTAQHESEAPSSKDVVHEALCRAAAALAELAQRESEPAEDDEQHWCGRQSQPELAVEAPMGMYTSRSQQIIDGQVGAALNHAVPFGVPGYAAWRQTQEGAAPAVSAEDIHYRYTSAQTQHAQAQQQQQAEAQQGAEPEPEPFSTQPRRKFVNNSNVKEGVSHQLAGLRRKAAIKQSTHA